MNCRIRSSTDRRRGRSWLRIYIWAVVISSVAYFGFNLARDIFGGEEAKVRKFIMQGKSRLEKRDIIGLSEMVSADYKDKYGNDRVTVVYGAKTFLAYYKDVFINIEKTDIVLNEAKDTAEAEVVALMIGKTKDGRSDSIMEGLEGEKDKFRLKLRKEKNGWKLLEIEFLQPLNIMGERVG
ncbi:MAG TPA: hypothetical protein PLV09_02360 [Candidatus Omnitrophota bacterium]|nr:hypothetical protein [Candidatus Omnitrophota bacterium]HOX09913.1 hypothetical protein [Candidatus Omnitrophota bacterium]HPN66242.1 hypothetical protein [Candidatus Omnitrophota bacterium]HRZ67437.1 hypothetical protein [Candidatus Omnitrophota bacterium]